MVLPITWEFRNGVMLKDVRGAVVMSNHQSILDIGTQATILSYGTMLLPITWELRNGDILRDAKGAIVMVNHQSFLDILGLFVIWNTLKDLLTIAKREILYLVPFGPAAWLAGVVFINRKNPASAIATMNSCKKRMIEEGFKMYMYPEGTRHPGRGMLPFKKGGFHTAIETGLPVIPIVYSPMYFIDDKKRMFKPGHVIATVLDPIPTKGLTKDDVDDLVERTRNAMLAEYEKLCAEIDTNLKNPAWVNQKRPRLKIVDSKKTY
ncbi:1-acyl-sn-glycerol-3-phosphate acyltransferase beta-like [Uranotaenia lowii]|uniref:1-acyl-sn-glycerol-3-phosphate acyltransferase beta-like n=1 Tax=Uranotaenia lowii TaxID=190385 RepID=UPI00247A2D58|nr:1-acyl-sn-glycerol-3-phosphate acyltransferase beta-like [Uranotaenia lowii]